MHWNDIAKRLRQVALAMGVVALPLGSHAAEGQKGVADTLYVLECGESRTHDVSFWSPGVNAGVAREFSDHCYLIRHGNDWLLWDTGMSDTIADKPEGVQAGGGILTLFVRRTLVSQLAELGLQPGDIGHLALSHFHGDHCGNANLFVGGTLYIQQAEHDAAFGPEPGKYGFVPALYSALRDGRTVKLSGDHDVFGDGSVTILSTPGHTPGHQSLLVRLPRRGAVVLSGDLTHFEDNWRHRRIPARNFDKALSARSMDRIAEVLAAEGAELWINHDRDQSAGLPKSPVAIE